MSKKRLAYNTKTDYYDSIIAYASANSITVPPLATQQAQRNKVNRLIAAQIFYKLDTYYCFAHNDPSLQDFARIDWKRLTQGSYIGDCTLTFYGIENISSGGFHLNINFFVDGERYKLDDASRFAGVYKEATGGVQNTMIDGVENANNINIMYNFNISAQRINQGTQSINGGNVDLSGTGNMTINRMNNTDVMLTNKDVIFNRTQSSSDVYNAGQRLLLRGDNIPSNAGLSYYGAGGALPYEQTQILREIENKYLEEIGLLPIM